MDLREKLAAAMKEEGTKKWEYEQAKDRVRELALEYYSLKLGVSPGDTVYSLVDDVKNGKRYKLTVVSFEIWTDDLDAQPDIIATTQYPFGESKEHRVFGRNWSVDPPDDFGNK